MKTRLFKYFESFTTKNGYFSDQKSCYVWTLIQDDGYKVSKMFHVVYDNGTLA